MLLSQPSQITLGCKTRACGAAAAFNAADDADADASVAIFRISWNCTPFAVPFFTTKTFLSFCSWKIPKSNALKMVILSPSSSICFEGGGRK